MINKFLAALSHTSSSFQLSNFSHPNAHAALEVSHAHAFNSWSELVHGDVGLDNRLRSLVLEVTASFSKHLPGCHEGLVLFLVEEAIAVGVGIREALINLSHCLLHEGRLFCHLS